MKVYLKKFTIVMLIIAIVFNFCGAAVPKAQAGVLDAIMGGLVGLLTWPIRLVAVLIGVAFQFVGAKVAYIGRHERIWRK